MRPIEVVLDKLEGVRSAGDGYMARCPCPDHGKGRGDQNLSLSLKEGDDGQALPYCFAGCNKESIVEALGLKMSDLFEQRDGSRGGGSFILPGSSSTHQPATLENYAAYVGLPVDFLKAVGLVETRYDGEPAVRMPYLDGSGEEVLLTRFRVSLTGKPKVKTKSGDKHRLYGLWRLNKAREAGYLWLFEGESDSQVGWHHGEPAVGIPGANGWKAEWASELDGIERLYFVVEDEAGEACWRKLAATPEIRERLYRVQLGGGRKGTTSAGPCP